MPRSTKDSDDDAEQKAGSTHQSVILRRSSRIKQGKSPTSSESDTNNTNSQSLRNTRRRTATMDSTVSEKLKRASKSSISSDISESIDVDILGTPQKRATRSSLSAVTSIGTPTKMSTRIASKRLTRAGSETKSPLPTLPRITRRTRASSVEPESLAEQNKSHPGTPVKTRRRVSELLESPIKEKVEKKNLIPYVQLDATIAEADEFINSGNSDSSPDKALRSQQSQRINTKRQSIQKNKVEEDNSHGKGRKTEENLSNNSITDEVFIQENVSNSSSFGKEDKVTNATSDNLTEVEKFKKSITKNLVIQVENLLDISIEQQKENPSNKENQTLNIINERLESNIQPSLSTKCLTPIHANKSSNEMEAKSTRNKSDLNKRRLSRESIEGTMKHDILSKEVTDDIEEKMDISTDSVISDLTGKQTDLESTLINDTTKRQSLVHETDSKSTTSDINKSILSQHEGTGLVASVEDKTPVKQPIKSTENTKEDTAQSDKVDTIGHTIDIDSDSEDSNTIELNKNLYLSKDQSKTEQKGDNKKSSISLFEIDENEMSLKLEEQSPCQNENKASSNILRNSDYDTVDLVAMSSANKKSNDQSNMMEKQSVITIDNIDSTEQEQSDSEHALKSASESSNDVLERSNSVSSELNKNNAVIQDTQLSNVTEAFEKTINMSSKKVETKILSRNIVKQDLKQKSTDNVNDHLEKEEENLQLESQKDTNTNINSDIIADTSVVCDISNDNSNKEKIEEEIDIENVSQPIQSNPQLLKEPENESETECELVLMNKKAWLTAENMKVAKAAESPEYDSDDTVLLKSRRDAIVVNNEDTAAKDPSTQLSIIREVMKEIVSSEYDSDDAMITNDEQINEFKAITNQRFEQSVSKLSKSGQTKATERSFKTHDESDEQVEDDATGLNKNSQVKKKNKSLSKSMERRKSSTSSSIQDTSSKQGNEATQNTSKNKSRKDYSEEESDDTAIHSEKKLQKKKRISLNKSQKKDDTDESEEENLSKPINVKLTRLNDKKNDNSKMVIPAMDFGHKNEARTEYDSCVDEVFKNSNPPSICNENSNSSSNIGTIDSIDSTSINSDVNREYNLDGKEQKFSDDSQVADECRASESEYSDSDDKGSDLADFIISDEEEEEEESNSEEENEENMEENTEEEEVNNENKENMEEDTKEEEVDDENENKQNVKEDKVAKEKQIKDKSKDNILDEEERDAKEKSTKYTSPCFNTKIKRNLKMKKPNKENKTILLDTSNSDSSIENKTGTQKNNTNLADTPNLSVKKKKKSNVQFSPKNVAGENLIEQLNKVEITLINLPKSRVSPQVTCSTPKLATFTQKFEFNETPKTLERDSEIKDKTPDIKTTQDTSLKKKKSKTDSIKQNISLKEFNRTSTEFNETPKTLERDSEIKNKTPDIKTTQDTSLKKKKSKKDSIKQNISLKEFNRTSTEFNETPKTLERDSEIKDKTPDIKTTQDTSLKKKKSKKDSIKQNISLKEFNRTSTEFNETPKTLERDSEIKDKTPDIKTTQDTSLKKKKSKKDSIKQNISLKEFNRTSTEKKLNSSLPSHSILSESMERATLKSTVSKLNELHKTINITHTESPTIRQLRKEKLSESTPALKLNVEINSKKKKLSPIKKEEHIAQPKTKLEGEEEEVPLINLSSDGDTIQKRKKKQKKRKTQAETISSSNMTDKVLSQDMMESDAPKKKKNVKVVQTSIAENDTCRDSQNNETEKKRKKRKFNVIEQDENVNEENVLQKNIRTDEPKLAQRKKKKYEIVDGSELDLSMDMAVEKKSKKVAETKEIMSKKLSKKKKQKEDKIAPLQSGPSKLKSNKNLASDKVQNIASDATNSNISAFAKAREEALEAIRVAEMNIRAKKELKKKRENIRNTIQEQALKIPDKKQGKKVVKKNDLLSSSTGRLKRLPEEVIENLTDQPKAKKRQKLSRNQEQIISLPGPSSKSKATTSKNDGFTLSLSGSTTKFSVETLQKPKKLKASSLATSLRLRMLARNREPISAYMMYCKKRQASTSDVLFNNEF